MTFRNIRDALGMAAFSMSLAAGAVLAAGSHEHGHGENAAGEPGEAAAATRTINVTMHDNYYEPGSIAVKEGETVRFVVTNKGELVHEFNIGTPDAHVAHAPEMLMMMDHGVLETDRINWDAAEKMQAEMGHGMHEEPNAVLLEPGKSGEIVWRFPDRAEIEFACNVPGHYDAGMAGTVTLTQ